MICHVWEKAVKADLGPVFVATDSPEIAQTIEAVGGQAVLTAASHPSGSDRIYEALCHIDSEGRYEEVINLQGDLPELDPALLEKLAEMLRDPNWDLTTLAAPASQEEAVKSQIVKAVVSFTDNRQARRPGPLFQPRSCSRWARGFSTSYWPLWLAAKGPFHICPPATFATGII